jgi:hypothetical protein
LQNSEELRQKGHDGSQKMTCCERGKKYHFQKGGGINIIFGPKYRPLGAKKEKKKTLDTNMAHHGRGKIIFFSGEG